MVYQELKIFYQSLAWMINLAIVEDDSLNRIYQYLVDVDEDFTPPLSERVEIKRYAEKLSSNAINVFVSINTQDIAHAAFYANDMSQSRAFLTSISVKSAARGRGVSDALMKDILLRSMKAGMTEIFLEVDATNTGAIRFYRKVGFEFSKGSDSTMFLTLKQ